jgi:hypothetical protein
MVLLAAAVFPACQCLNPVPEWAEPGDAGADSGTPVDAGGRVLTCSDWGAECGAVGDGVGGAITCGQCQLPATCGGGGKPLRCGAPVTPFDAGPGDGGPCVARTCAEVGASCGDIPSDCGGLLDCGACADGGLCSGNVCVVRTGCPAGSCCPNGCASMGWSCGVHGDGCGGIVQCGECDGGLTCGGGAFPSRCGKPPVASPPGCQPKACWEAGAACGAVDDGCGHSLHCGDCDPAWGVCSGLVANICAWWGFVDGGSAHMTGGCAAWSANCGYLPDGDGGLVLCGKCDAGSACGAVVPFLCYP